MFANYTLGMCVRAYKFYLDVLAGKPIYTFIFINNIHVYKNILKALYIA